MDHEIDVPSRIVPPPPIKRTERIPQKRPKDERDESAVDDEPNVSEDEAEGEHPRGKSTTGGSELDLMV